MSSNGIVFSHRCRQVFSPAAPDFSSGTRVLTIGFSFVIAIVFYSPGGALAQTCPGTPEEFPHGGLVVLEGLVVADGAGEVSRGQDAAVAIDDPAVGEARFIVTWVTDLMLGDNIWYDEVLAVGFTADGTCIRDPEAMSNEDPSCPPPYFCTLTHYHPSVAMSTDHRVRIGCVENLVIAIAGERGLNKPGALLLADFDFDAPNWPIFLSPYESNLEHDPSVGVSDAIADVTAVGW